MTDEEPVATFVVLTEDSAEAAPETVTRLLKKMLGAIAPYDATRLAFKVGEKGVREGAAGNAWRCHDEFSNPNVTRLLRFLVTRVLREDHYIFFHVDGDTTWSNRAKSKTVADFDERVVARVAKQLVAQNIPSARVAAMLSRIVRCTPHYSIEAWCYQNTKPAAALAMKHGGRGAAACFEEWERDRGALDEIEKPKSQTCLSSAHNHELAGPHYPVADVLAAGKSFADTHERLRAADALVDVISRCARVA